MTTFTVSTSELVKIAQRVASTATDLRAASRVAGEYHGAAGAPAIDRQLDDFFSQWSDAIDVIAHDLDGVMNRLINAADQYGGAERAVTDAAGGGGGG